MLTARTLRKSLWRVLLVITSLLTLKQSQRDCGTLPLIHFFTSFNTCFFLRNSKGSHFNKLKAFSLELLFTTVFEVLFCNVPTYRHRYQALSQYSRTGIMKDLYKVFPVDVTSPLFYHEMFNMCIPS